MSKSIVMERGAKHHDADKMILIPVENMATECEALLCKSGWMKIKLPADSIHTQGIKVAMRKNGLRSACEEASCPNLAEYFSHGTATFMILGATCTRRYPFCDVTHGRLIAPDANEPVELTQTVADTTLRYVAITSVNRGDPCDGGVQHFTNYIAAIREKSPQIKIEALMPDFHGHMDYTLDILTTTPPGVFNHNLRNVPHIYRQIRSGAGYDWSLKLLERFKEAHPEIPTKSGLMVGLGETDEETIKVMCDLCRHGVTMLTLGRYLQPSRHHLSVQRHVSPGEFDGMKAEALAMGFTHVACDPFIRFSYHADLQVKGMEVK